MAAGRVRSAHLSDAAVCPARSWSLLTLCLHASARRKNVSVAYLISPTAATGANFAMFLATMGPDALAAQPSAGVERCAAQPFFLHVYIDRVYIDGAN